MKVTAVLENNSSLSVVPVVRGINEAGAMALTAGADPSTGYFRGLLESGKSGIAAARKLGGSVSPLFPILYPDMRPLTNQGQFVWGYEDPSYLVPGDNFVEPGTAGLLLTEAYIDCFEPWRVHTNLLYLGLETGRVETVLTPGEAMSRGLDETFKEADMVKEAHVVRLDGSPRLLFEVAADGHSHLAIADIRDGQITDARLWDLTVTEGTWYDTHLSTVAPPVPMGDGMKILFLNGCSVVKGEAGASPRWAIGVAAIDAAGKIVAVSENPVITPPRGCFLDASGSEILGPGGQDIAFGSDARPNDDGSVSLYYHAQDKFLCQAVLSISIDE